MFLVLAVLTATAIATQLSWDMVVHYQGPDHELAWHNEHKYVDTIEDLNSDTQQVKHITPPIEQPFFLITDMSPAPNN